MFHNMSYANPVACGLDTSDFKPTQYRPPLPPIGRIAKLQTVEGLIEVWIGQTENHTSLVAPAVVLCYVLSR